MCVRRLAWVADLCMQDFPILPAQRLTELLGGWTRVLDSGATSPPRRPGEKVGGLNQGSPYSFEQSVKNNGDESQPVGQKRARLKSGVSPPLHLRSRPKVWVASAIPARRRQLSAQNDEPRSEAIGARGVERHIDLLTADGPSSSHHGAAQGQPLFIEQA